MCECENIPTSASTPKADMAAELTTFINHYYHPDSNRKDQKQIPMKKLRHVIPLLVLHCFDMKDNALHKKVKGLWVQAPADWPESVPFCDPNNSKKKGEQVGKPKKDKLESMFKFLIKTYWEKSGTCGQVYSDRVEPVQEGIIALEHGYTRKQTPYPNLPVKRDTSPTPMPSDQTQNSQFPTSQIPNNQLPNSQRQDNTGATNATMSKAFVEENVSVMEAENDEDSDPIKETVARLLSKINMLREKKLIPDQHLGLLLIIHDLLNKMCNMIQDNLSKRFVIEKAHEFEATVDIAEIEKSIPKTHREKWSDFKDDMKNDELNIDKFLSKLIEMRIYDLGTKVTKSTVFSNVSYEHNDDMIDLLTKLNIQPTNNKTAEEIMNFDCVQVRFMKNVDDKENVEDDPLPNKTRTSEEKLINQCIYENLELGVIDECSAYIEPSVEDIEYLNRLMNIPTESIDEEIASVADSEESTKTQNSDRESKSYIDLKNVTSQTGDQNPFHNIVENTYLDVTFSELAYSGATKEDITDIVKTSPSHEQVVADVDAIYNQSFAMTEDDHVVTEHIYGQDIDPKFANGAKSWTGDGVASNCHHGGFVCISQNDEMETTYIDNASGNLREMNNLSVNGNVILSEHGLSMIDSVHDNVSSKHPESKPNNEYLNMISRYPLDIGFNVTTQHLSSDNCSQEQNYYDSKKPTDPQILPTPFSFYPPSPTAADPADPLSHNKRSPNQSGWMDKPLRKPDQPILKGLFYTAKPKQKRAGKGKTGKTGGKEKMTATNNCLCDVTNSKPQITGLNRKRLYENLPEDPAKKLKTES